MQPGNHSKSHCFVIHPSEIVRQGLAMLVGRRLKQWKVVQAGGIDEIYHERGGGSDVIVVTDVAFSENVPDLAAMSRTLSAFPNRVVVFCSSPTSWGWGAVAALQGGARAVIGPESSIVDLHNALDAVVDQTKYVSADIAMQLAECDAEKNQEAVSPHRSTFGLTQSESTVLTELLEGAKLKELAHALCVSVKTVSSYKKRALKKLGVSSLLHVAGIKGALLSDYPGGCTPQATSAEACFCR